MGLEEGPSMEASKVRLTTEEFDEIRNVNVLKLSDQELAEFIDRLSGLGLELDSGDIKILVDGEPATITTRRDDFGTTLFDDTKDIPSGY